MTKNAQLLLCSILALCSLSANGQLGEENPVKNCCRGQNLRVAIRGSDAPPFVYFRPAGTLPQINKPFDIEDAFGFSPTVLANAVSVMGATIDFYPLDPNLTEDEEEDLIGLLLANETIDAHYVYGVTVKSFGKEALGGAFSHTVSSYHSSISGVVKLTSSAANIWSFLDPFDNTLWIMLVVGTFVVSFCLAAMHCLDDIPEGATLTSAFVHMYETLSVRSLLDAVYKSTAVLLAADSYDWPTASEQILRTGWLFFALVVGATYTANLAAFFTAPNFSIHTPPSNMADLIHATACTTSLGENQYPLAHYVKSFIIPEGPDCGPWSQCAQDYCYQAVQNGTVDVWLDDALALHEYIQVNGLCGTLYEVKSLDFLPMFASIILKMSNKEWEFAANLSAAFTWVTTRPAYLLDLERFFYIHQDCSQGSAIAKVTFKELHGLFIIAIITCASAMAYSMGFTLLRVRPKGATTPLGRSSSLRALDNFRERKPTEAPGTAA
mmetsp:Transcript_22463/g.37549  ORF Transcript_22463/g.37549 Transcript_22463/m.37549 type:complete len:495 (+) Transcript_22463:325-1809(+)|eukprot:CAMPEP_0198199680 /NCGR_PEP_ID=MMETSP1445-20131203/2896_1 /TAXON_ID=36898 /ORGANISM="Pyramimonas sp., Strain CCMP2087" /LENGTH=494 /DNA_ID=CAMNT_0043869569 /DNA_START=278 /DNA_END=1762 /DNA_ORIENTATION=-